MPTKLRRPALGTVARLSRLIADIAFRPDSGPITTSEGMPRIVRYGGDGYGMKMTDDFLPREHQNRPPTIPSGETELPDLPAVHFGHRWALRMGSNSSGATGWRAYPSRWRRTFSSIARRLSQSSKASRMTSERRRRAGFTAASTAFKRESSIRIDTVFAMLRELQIVSRFVHANLLGGPGRAFSPQVMLAPILFT